MKSHYYIILSLALLFPLAIIADTKTDPGIAASEKRVLAEDTLRDSNLRSITGNDTLTGEIIANHSLIVGSKITLSCQQPLYSWLVDHIQISAELARFFGKNYTISPGKKYEFHGTDGEGMSVDFYRAYHDSATTILVGDGQFKIFFMTVSGAFINYMEYNNIDSTHMVAQNAIYVRINNPVTRMFASVVFAISDVEKKLMEKIFALDDTVYAVVKTLMEDPHLSGMLLDAGSPAPEDASDISIKIRDTIVRVSSVQKARELGAIVKEARR